MGGNVVKKTVSGSMASFNDGSINLAERLFTDINFGQAGTGEPSPANVRAISGFSNVKVFLRGKNLINPNIDSDYYSGITYTVNSDKSITINGTATALSVFYLTEGFGFNHFAKGVTYKFKVNGDDTTDIRIQIYSNNAWLAEVTHGVGTFTLPANSVSDYARIRIGSGTTVNNVTIRPMIVENADTVTEWIPPQGEDYTTDLGRTVYKGTLDVVSGLLTVTHAMIQATSVNRQGVVNDSYYAYHTTDIPPGVVTSQYPEAYCDCYAVARNGDARRNGTFYLIGGNLVFVNDAFTSVAEANAIISQQKPTVVYPLATPQVYQLDSQQIETLLGVNNIWTNSGDVSVTYVSSDSSTWLDVYSGKTKASMVVLPSPVSIKPTFELIWSENTGRAQSGSNKAKMIGDVVAEKKTYQIEWGIISDADMDRIKTSLPRGFFYFGIGVDLSAVKPSATKFYRSEISGEMISVGGSLYWKGVSVSVIEQ